MNRRKFLQTSLEGIILASTPSNLRARDSSAGGELLWKIQLGSKIFKSSPAIAKDGIIYVGSYYDLYAVNPDGTLKWKFPTNYWLTSSPSIGDDGAIYIGSGDTYMYAINPDNTLKWKFQAENIISSSPAIANDGTIYIGRTTSNYYSGPGNIYAVNPDGTLKWKFPKDTTIGQIESTPAIAKDGTIYIGSHDGGKNFYALNPDGTLKWDFQADGWLDGGVSIDKDGTIYLAGNPQTLYALNPDGSLKWRYDTYGGYPQSSPIIGEYGRVYFNCGGNLIALDHNGNFIFANSDFVNDQSSPVIAEDGIIYTGCGGYDYHTQYTNPQWNYGLIAVEPSNFSTLWDYKTGTGVLAGESVRSSPILYNGIVYFATDAGYLYAIDTGTKANVANTPWPMFGQNLRRTSNAADYEEPVHVNEEKPGEFALRNYPNPFNSSTLIKYQLPENSNVRLDIYNANGQKIKTLVDRVQNQGQNQVKFDGNGLSSGVYFYKLSTPNSVKTEKMMLVK